MCLYVKSGPHKAKHDFHVLKVASIIDRKYFTYYRSKEMYLGEDLISNIVVTGGFFNNEKIVHHGIHAYYLNPAKNGFNSVMVGIFDGELNKAILLAKISKGTDYYLGKHSDIVASKLTIIEPLLISDSSDLKLEQPIMPISNLELALKYAYSIARSFNIRMEAE